MAKAPAPPKNPVLTPPLPPNDPLAGAAITEVPGGSPTYSATPPPEVLKATAPATDDYTAALMGGSDSTAVPPDVKAAATAPDTSVATPPPGILPAIGNSTGADTIGSLTSPAVAAPKKTFLQKVKAALPYVGAVGAGLEAASTPAGRTPEGAALLERSIEGQRTAALTEHAQEIQAQKNAEEAQYHGGLLKQYGMVPAGVDANGNPIYMQQKDVGRYQGAKVIAQGRENAANIKGKFAVDVAQINQGLGIPVDPTVAQIIGMPEIAGVPAGKATHTAIAKALQERGYQYQDFGTNRWLTDRFGNKIKNMGPSNLWERAMDWAAAKAANTGNNVMGPNGPQFMSVAKQLQTGTPTLQGTLATGNALDKVYQPALDADTRLKQMYQQATDVSGASDQALLFNHIAMTGGNVKGLRMGEYITEAHRQARGIPEDLTVLWNRLAAGETLSPQQRINFVHLAENVRQSVWDRARRQAPLSGLPNEPAPDPDLPPLNPLSSTQTVSNNSGSPAQNGTGVIPKGEGLANSQKPRVLDENGVRALLKEAGGDVAKARALAKKRNLQIPK